jgi:hypothetical protein
VAEAVMNFLRVSCTFIRLLPARRESSRVPG